MADALDADPFVLLLLRGRTRDQVLAGVRVRRRVRQAAVASSGTDAGDEARVRPSQGG